MLFSSEGLTELRARLGMGGGLQNSPQVMSPLRPPRADFQPSLGCTLTRSRTSLQLFNSEHELDAINQLGGNIKPIFFLWQHLLSFDKPSYCPLAKKNKEKRKKKHLGSHLCPFPSALPTEIITSPRFWFILPYLTAITRTYVYSHSFILLNKYVYVCAYTSSYNYIYVSMFISPADKR